MRTRIPMMMSIRIVDLDGRHARLPGAWPLTVVLPLATRESFRYDPYIRSHARIYMIAAGIVPFSLLEMPSTPTERDVFFLRSDLVRPCPESWQRQLRQCAAHLGSRLQPAGRLRSRCSHHCGRDEI